MSINKRSEFLIYKTISGEHLGRFYVLHSDPFFNEPHFSFWRNSVVIHHTTYYRDANLYWFVAPVLEYRKLAIAYPHHKPSYCAKTFSRLRQIAA